MTRLHFAEALTPDGWQRDVLIEIAGGVITALTAGSPKGSAETHAIGLPGVASLHSHAFQRGMAGLAEFAGPGADSFWSWREVMYRFALSMTPDQVEAVASELYIEMLEAGFTRVGEFHYLHHDRDGRPYANIAEMAERIAAASANSGIGLTLLPVFYAHSSFGGNAPSEGQRRFINDLDSYARLHEASRHAIAGLAGANIGIAPHSLRAATEAELRHLLETHVAGPVHIHIAEQVREVEDSIAHSGQRPVEWLLDHLPVDERWCLIHATHMTAEETSRFAATGAVAGLCPITEANLGDGIFPGRDFIQHGGHYGVGSDSNVEISLAGELRMLDYSQRLGARSRNQMAVPGKTTGRSLFDAALSGGQRALSQRHDGLAVGGPADIVSLDATSPQLVARHGDQMLDGWIFSAGNSAIDCVWTAGIKRVIGGRHVDRDQIEPRFRQAMTALLA